MADRCRLRFMEEGKLLVTFLDTFTDSTAMVSRTSDSGHTWSEEFGASHPVGPYSVSGGVVTSTVPYYSEFTWYAAQALHSGSGVTVSAEIANPGGLYDFFILTIFPGFNSVDEFNYVDQSPVVYCRFWNYGSDLRVTGAGTNKIFPGISLAGGDIISISLDNDAVVTIMHNGVILSQALMPILATLALMTDKPIAAFALGPDLGSECSITSFSATSIAGSFNYVPPPPPPPK